MLTLVLPGRSQPFSPLPSSKGLLPDGGYQLEVSGPENGVRWVLAKLREREWIDGATHSLSLQFSGRLVHTHRLVFGTMTVTRSRYDKWEADGWVWSMDAESTAGDMSAWDDGMI
eukprot:3111853-Rhodomonas_salina.1